MSNISNQIPDVAALERTVHADIKGLTERVVVEVGDLEQEYKRIIRRRRYAKLCGGVAAFLLIFVSVFSESNLSDTVWLDGLIGGLFLLLIFPSLLGLGFATWRLYRDPSNVTGRFNRGLNNVLFPEIAALFGMTGQVVETTVTAQTTDIAVKAGFWTKARLQATSQPLVLPEHEQVLALLDHSELITEPRNQVLIDDMMYMTLDERILFLSELSVKHVTGSGKNRRTKKIFKGYFLSFDLNRPLTGKTFVSSEGDKKGFGHQSFWKSLRGTGAQETILEWNDFEALLHVASTDPTEARYILTPNFMAELHDWWVENKTNIRLSFVDNRMYILFPDSNIRLHNTVPALDQESLYTYVMSVAKPLMHVLHLVEKVKV